MDILGLYLLSEYRYIPEFLPDSRNAIDGTIQQFFIQNSAMVGKPAEP